MFQRERSTPKNVPKCSKRDKLGMGEMGQRVGAAGVDTFGPAVASGRIIGQAEIRREKGKTMKATVNGDKLTLILDLNGNPVESSSGKTRIAATTHGFTVTDARVAGKPLSVSVNATIPNN